MIWENKYTGERINCTSTEKLFSYFRCLLSKILVFLWKPLNCAIKPRICFIILYFMGGEGGGVLENIHPWYTNTLQQYIILYGVHTFGSWSAGVLFNLPTWFCCWLASSRYLHKNAWIKPNYHSMNHTIKRSTNQPMKIHQPTNKLINQAINQSFYIN